MLDNLLGSEVRLKIPNNLINHADASDLVAAVNPLNKTSWQGGLPLPVMPRSNAQILPCPA